jgi:hypothetical protein
MAAFAAAATHYNLIRSMWLDEYFTWSRTGGSVADTIEHAYFTSTKPPVYFLAVHWWRAFSDSIEWVRFGSTVSILGALVALHRLSRTLGIPTDWRSVAVLAAFVPHFLYVGAEARVYALCLMFLCWATYWWARIWIADAPKPGWTAAAFVAASYLAILTFYYAGFVVAGLLLAAFLYPERRVYAFRAGAALTALLIPWLPLVSVQVAGQGTYLDPLATEGEPVSVLASSGKYLFSQLLDTVFRLAPLRSRPGFGLAIGGGLVAVLLARVALARPRWTRAESKVAIAAGIGVAALLGLRALNQVHADVRHWVVIVPGLLVLPLLLISRIEHRILRLGLAAGALGAVAAGGLSFVRNERGSYDFKSAAAGITAAERPGQPVVFFDGNPGPFLYYYRGVNVVRRVPADQDIPRGSYEFTPEETIRLANLLGHAAGPERTFWIVEKYREGWKLAPGTDIVSRYYPDSVSAVGSTPLHLTRVVRGRLSDRPDTTAGTP